MNRWAEILVPLKLPALVLASVIGLAILLLYASGRYSGAMEDAHSEVAGRLTDANIRLQRLHSQEASFRSDAEAFGRLEAQGVRGPEQRLRWIDLMRQLPAEAGVARASFQLAAQRPYARLPTDSGGPLRLSATAVSLQLEAVHEGRLLRFLDALQTRTPGLLVVRACQLEGGSGPVRASCNLDWITLDP
jgi:hypothetical protein